MDGRPGSRRQERRPARPLHPRRHHHMRKPRTGLARLIASCDKGVTRLTCVSHRAPARLLPLRGALAGAAGAATCVLGSYGGGLLGGDQVDVHVEAEADATLVLGTQASTKVYRTNADAARQRIHARVHPGALLVFTPDPLVPFANSAYEGAQRFDLHRGSSLVAVDWLGGGRTLCGERWAFNSYSSRTEARLVEEEGERDRLALVESLSLQPGCPVSRAASFDVGGVSRDAAVSVLVSGPRASGVAAQLHAAAALLAQRRTGGKGVRDARDGEPSVLHNEAQAAAGDAVVGKQLVAGLLGDIVLGVSDVPLPRTSADDESEERPVLTLARLVAEYNEDVYRVLNHCLAPLKPAVGVTPYSDRVHASAAAPPAVLQAAYLSGGRSGEHRTSRWRRPPVLPSEEDASTVAPATMLSGSSVSGSQVLRLVHLCDATMPTGGFAHSGGLEAALQLGLLGSRGDASMHASLRQAGTVAIVSAAQQQVPFAIEAHARVTECLPHLASPDAEKGLAHALRSLNEAQHALLVPNAPGCRASLQVGGALTRIISTWMDSEAPAHEGGNRRSAAAAARALKLRGGAHGSIAMGALAATLDLPADSLLGAFIYTSSRDLISAAVRLNLIGPLAAVALQDQIVNDAAARSSSVLQLDCAQAAGSAPLLEAAHACHDLLERRVFNT